MTRIIIACPANVTTGGPELLHQLCSVLRMNKFEAYMYYYNFGFRGDKKSPVPTAYEKYNNPFITKYKEADGDIFVAPEININLLIKLKKAKRIVWWLSVDNFYYVGIAGWKRPFRKLKYIIDMYNLPVAKKYTENISNRIANFIKVDYEKQMCVKRERESTLRSMVDCMHLVQSQYAYEHCEKIGIEKDRIHFLSDYLNDEYLDVINNLRIENNKREDIILFNPKKGAEITKKIIKADSSLRWVPLIGFTREEMIDIMCKAKLYVDFGNHPGKDRIPREAAACGCCVITGKRGSAAYYEDVSIPEKYKFSNENDCEPILEMIRFVLSNYEVCCNDFIEYKKNIKKEKDEFVNDAIAIFKSIVAD